MKPSELPPIVTPAQMRAIDERAIRSFGIPSLTLMENAGRAVADVICEDIFDGKPASKRIAIVCGPGNNGGDGLVITRYLKEARAEPQVFLLGVRSQLKGDAQANLKRAVEAGISIAELSDASPLPTFSDCELIVDAIYGTGFHGEITGLAARVIEAINNSAIRVVAVDTPSGLDGETGSTSIPTVRADYTDSLAATKRGQWLWPGRAYVGDNETIDIGIPREAIEQEGITLRLITREFVRQNLPARPPDAHKGTFGKGLIIGGSAGMSGAVVLACRAALRAGVGLAYAGVPESLVDVVDAGSIESVVKSLPEVRTKRTLAKRALGEIVKLSEAADAVAIGPGLSTHHETQELVRRLVLRRSKPTVLDADGLNACAKDTSCLEVNNEVPLIITPHAGEMARLFGRTLSDVAEDREAVAREATARFQCIVVMKGAPTFVAEPSGVVYLNPTGNSGMATGGVGDVLTGIIVSLLAQGSSPLVAALCGVYLHGLAGDFAAEVYGSRSLVASDVADSIADVLQNLEAPGEC